MIVLVAANMSGHELPLMVIGKSLKLRCLKNVKNLPVQYTANKRAWMTSTIFETWRRKLDRIFFLLSISIAVIVHPNIDGLRSIKLVFLAPNTTSHLQSCDQGIIHSLKRYYRARVVKNYLDNLKDKMPTNPG